MEVLSSSTKFAHLGKPGTIFSQGFARRLELLREQVDLEDKIILDSGAGEGVWLDQFTQFTPAKNVFGSDIDPELISKARKNTDIPEENIVVAPAENLPWPDNHFDVVFSNEVLEHVEDDIKAVAEAFRVLKPGGVFVVFTPNRGWPFETHGIFLGDRYIWGNIPLLPWLPQVVYRRFAPHVRNYSNRAIRKLIKNSGFEFDLHKHVFPGFDGLVRRFGFLGRAIRKTFHLAEKTPLHFFGISHFIVARKPSV